MNDPYTELNKLLKQVFFCKIETCSQKTTVSAEPLSITKFEVYGQENTIYH